MLLTFALADELGQAALHLALDGAPRPLAGWHRAAWHVSVALSLGWPAALAWTAQKTNGPENPSRCPPTSIDSDARGRVQGSGERAHRSTDILLRAYLGTFAGLAIVYPPGRAHLRWTLLVWELVCVAVAAWGLARRWRATWGAAEVCLVILVSCEAAVVIVGPFASDPFTRWWIARCFYLGAWGAVCGVLVKSKSA